MDEYKYLLFIAVLGSEQVGKKSLAKSKFLENPSDLDYMVTIGMEFSTKTVEIDEIVVKLLFRIFSHSKYRWDRTRKGNLEIHLRHSHGAIILYDVTNSKSIEQIPQWIQIVKDNAGDIPILLVGNKLDLEQRREVTKEQIETIKNEHNIAASMKISAKTGENVEKMIMVLSRMILQNLHITYEK